MFRSISDSCHNCSRGSKYQCARAKHNKDSNCTNNFIRKCPSQTCSSKRNHNNPSCPSIRKTNNFCLIRIGRLYQLNHSLNGTVLTDFYSFHFKCTKLIDRTRKYLITNYFIYRERFSCHNRLIYRSLTRNDNTINSNRFTRQNTNDITNLYLLGRNNLFFTVHNNSCCLRR